VLKSLDYLGLLLRRLSWIWDLVPTKTSNCEHNARLNSA
jgi:hypothetical protein